MALHNIHINHAVAEGLCMQGSVDTFDSFAWWMFFDCLKYASSRSLYKTEKT